MEEKMDAMDYGDGPDDKPMSTDTLEHIFGGSQSHPNINRREACYNIRDQLKKIQLEWKMG